jgi:hypothetical protein
LNPQAEAFIPGYQPPAQARSNPNPTGDGLNQSREDRLAAEAKRKAEEEALARIEAERYAAGFRQWQEDQAKDFNLDSHVTVERNGRPRKSLGTGRITDREPSVSPLIGNRDHC